MKEIFDIQRFGKYLGADLTRAWSRYGLTLIVAAFSNCIAYIIFKFICLLRSLPLGGEYTVSGGILVVAAVVVTCSVASMIYGHITDRRKGSAFLMLPASTMEKYISMLLICLVVVPGLFFGVFCGTDALLAAVDANYTSTISLSDGTFENGATCYDGFISYFYAIMAFLLGALCFKRHKISLTILTMVLIGIVLGMVAVALVAVFCHNMYIGINLTLYLNANYRWLVVVVETLVAVGLVLAGYLRLRKIQH